MGEYNLELEDRLYTSTEVAKILGVSLRSVYRYLEDEKLTAEMKTATGRHRFTKQNILDFLYPQKSEEEEKEEVVEKESPKKKEVKKEEPKEVEEEEEEEEVEEEVEEEEETDEEEVDWLSKFRKAAEKYKAESEDEEEEKEEVSGLAGDEEEEEVEEEVEEEEEAETTDRMFYTSEAGGLKEVAQKLDKSAKKASLDYAFTMQAGLSLHKPISPFSLIHAYVKSEDLPFFEKILDLTEAKESDAQLCLIIADEDSVYKNAEEMHGLNVAANERLKKDLLEAGEDELAEEL